MSIHEWFLRKKTEKQQKNGASERLNIPENLWLKCPSCKSTIYIKELNENLKVCPKCDFHFRLSASERINLIIDSGTFKEMSITLKSTDFLGFVDSKAYNKRIDEAILKSGLNEAIVIGEGLIENIKTVFGVMDFSFMGGSMGSGVGEKFTRMIEHSIENKIPAIIATSSGGARMQEGILSLMQMAKVSAALGRLRENGLPYIVLLTDPTTGGTTASFAMLGDIQIAEPKALIGFAGPRVIEQTIRQKLPKGFQRSEFLLEHGMIDLICERKDIKSTLAKILRFFEE
ncbi:acetyl-CoA carboxylase subunit beta [candidate division WOR-1 bacterium RIFOXYA2_FULL_36_21]|uniref:Acetyl-coenzyme A carboxylase carboxyl transferase subunit beta n=1 Tax=candidate division WOR-1 bacterium RIFOXYB2_FULL_36_35 TaxID=1802578 RepID=A0A1F4S7A9_UNCSA|nr:MAG: acetyl-CoA carboxylase subunit beta [candidate division WOR-1 bacterium RIFOXYA2_FULL_36_21]OGC15702.1 MAG: acetyl-CoA carboxylase subunit beta [candidate division WOR-1 bacterium RIFOXYA12_FULL_36_13]OGC16300.1 MAG: acetyl-CoA carboxylase subunit beta [candidate division WOR-1 bacterium RIFOXYB2_FULL_36_35]